MSIEHPQTASEALYAADPYELTNLADAAKQTAEQLTAQTLEQSEENIEQAVDKTEFFADITASSSALQQTLTTVTQSWINAMLDTFNQTNAIIWSMVNWTGADLPALRGSDSGDSTDAAQEPGEPEEILGQPEEQQPLLH